jgi:hypothetical protein
LRDFRGDLADVDDLAVVLEDDESRGAVFVQLDELFLDGGDAAANPPAGRADAHFASPALRPPILAAMTPASF